MSKEYTREHTLTIGELAQAISAGHVSYSQKDGCYVVTHRAARHFVEEPTPETLRHIPLTDPPAQGFSISL